MNIPFNFPPLKDNVSPIWQGDGFRVGNDQLKILSYSENHAGWSDELTHYHEEIAGEYHFIDNASRLQAISQIEKYCKTKNPIILEIGCSSGFFLKQMRENFPHATIMGADVVYQPLVQLSKQIPDVPLLRFDLVNCPLPDNCVDVVVLLNVLEHIEHDFQALQQIQRILKPGGIAVLEVPANPKLYDNYDKMFKHFRRYTASQMSNLIQKSKMDILMQSHLGFFLYPGFWIVKKFNQYRLGKDNTVQRSTVTKNISRTKSNVLLKTLMKLELLLGKYISYPTGIRCLMTCTPKKK